MLVSMYSAVSGLSMHQTKMDVIGNNIANVNTYGFKSGRVVFSDIFYQNYSSASAPTTNSGGTNSSQLGYGASIGSIDVLNARGGSATTDRTLDVYINGDGYLPVQDSSGNTLYTRLGTLYFDVEGNMVDSSGKRVLGLPMDENGVVQLGEDGTTNAAGLVAIAVEPERLKELTSISIGASGQITAIEPGEQTMNMAAGTNWIKEANISDTSLYAGTVKVLSAKPTGAYLSNAKEGVTATGLTVDSSAITENKTAATPAITDETVLIGKVGQGKNTYTFKFDGTNWDVTDNTGRVVGNAIAPADLPTEFGVTVTGTAAADETFTLEVNDSVNMNGDAYLTGSGDLEYTYKDALGNIKTDTITPKSAPADDGTNTTYVFDIPVSGTATNTVKKEVTLVVPNTLITGNKVLLGTVTPAKVEVEASVYNKAGVEQNLKGTWDASIAGNELALGDMTLEVDPAKLGALDFSKLENKKIGTVGAGDGKVVTIGQLALSTFINADGLNKAGEGYYAVSSNSGEETISVPGSNGTGSIVASSLEMSNVDLAAEFTEMIFAQRGFQANSRVITTSDTLLEELVNLVR